MVLKRWVATDQWFVSSFLMGSPHILKMIYLFNTKGLPQIICIGTLVLPCNVAAVLLTVIEKWVVRCYRCDIPRQIAQENYLILTVRELIKIMFRTKDQIFVFLKMLLFVFYQRYKNRPMLISIDKPFLPPRKTHPACSILFLAPYSL